MHPYSDAPCQAHRQEGTTIGHALLDCHLLHRHLAGSTSHMSRPHRESVLACKHTTRTNIAEALQ